MKAPKLDASGVCPPCSTSGGWSCAYHQAEGVRKFNEREAVFRQVAQSIRFSRIVSLCAEHELESDEFYTREQKAERMLA